LDFFEEDDAPTSDEPAVGRRRPPRATPDSFDEEAPPPRGGRGGGGGGGGSGNASHQQIRSRQLTFIGISIVVLILLFLAVRGCLDQRKERSFKNYVSDLSSLTVETKQLSDDFFKSLTGQSEGDISVENQVNGERATAQTLLDRAQNLDAPDELSEAQSQIVLSYQLRSDAIATTAEQLPKALGNSGAKKASKEIAEQMRVLLASDVLYGRARAQIEQELTDQEIVVEEGVPESEFLPTGNNDPNWLDQADVDSALAAIGSGGGGSNLANCEDDGQTHGLGLVSTTANPSGVVLQPGTPTSVPADGLELEIAVMNQGDAAESDIRVALSGDFSGNQTISTIDAGETQTVTIRPNPAPSSGDSGSVTVTVDTVCGEQVDTNNESTYELTFE
jgi:hypothetical protein